MDQDKVNRRQFMRKSATFAGTAWLATYAPSLFAETPRYASDLVPLGKTGLKLSRLGFGTGSNNGQILRDLGMDQAVRLLQYAFDQGITYIDTAENYHTHPIVAQAIKGMPREKFFIQTKIPGVPDRPLEVLDRYRKELGVDYIDSVLLHCMEKSNWDKTHRSVMDALIEAKEKGMIRAHGVSCHMHGAVTKAAQLDWVDVNLVRFNPQAVCCDKRRGFWVGPSNQKDLEYTMSQMKIMRNNKHGIIGMKIIGNGEFTRAEDREKSIRFAMQPGLVDAVVIGFKNTAEVDEAITRINNALAAGDEQT